jgi:hypothetical protein
MQIAMNHEQRTRFRTKPSAALWPKARSRAAASTADREMKGKSEGELLLPSAVFCAIILEDTSSIVNGGKVRFLDK